MRLSARGLLASPWFGALLAFLTTGIILPSEARAGCSAHYIVSPSRSSGELSRLELLGHAGALATPQGETPTQPPAPCSGALCSGNPALPLSTIPSDTPPVGGHWAILAFPRTLIGPVPFLCLPVDVALRPIDHSCSIFHPPRSQ
jgi:hypothetical protein